MSFVFHAIGSRRDVLAQLAAEQPPSVAAKAARDLAAEVIFHDTDAPPGSGREVRYVVRCSGHDGGGLSAALDLRVESMAVPVTP